ncbi:Starch-binding associating with outer membrane [Chitinophaga jiangningensis]|uniref:Starch-binding associating with outer membrane n=1 Tax=Chitinophaga jiangningensis TaxID=1419482 RepID=A0A1M7JCI0_9BACT|nr:RagB/SusD family nutrient uptake outer membrane protein [Chitinophaga jiangningensis]SHM50709.1 Starch-binding associating with outer membrane [Chitinophaga jiangningensis]
MMKLKITGLFFTAVMLFSGCSDKFLDLQDKQNLTESTFWATRQHALQGITATYGALQGYDGDKWTFFEQVYVTLAFKGDDIDNNKNEPYGKNLAAFVNSADESGPWSLWATCYTGIGRANQVIQKVPGITVMTEQERKEIVGEAKFLRAYNYFVLVNGFEHVPLVLEFVKDLDKLQVPQAPVADVWAQIEKDLTEAEAVLPESYASEYKGRATKGAAKALLAKTYLYQEKWAQAEAKFRELHGKYALNANYVDNFNGTKENGPESIFEIQWSGDRTVSDERHPFNFEGRPYALDGWEVFYPSDWVVAELKKDKTDAGEYSDRVYGNIFFDDPKSTMWDLNVPASQIPYSSVASDLSRPAYYNKYAYPNDRSGSYVGYNISLIRYADVLLMLAEAANENGKTDEAIGFVNEVRTRSHAKALAVGSMTKDQLREQIRHHERPVELAMEFGIRWFDLVRWGRGNTAKQAIKTVLQNHGKPFSSNYVEDKHIRYPIPLKEINTNPLLKQNNLY